MTNLDIDPGRTPCTKRRYDPENLFRLNQNIQPAR
jgi:Berberine and berberine like